MTLDDISFTLPAAGTLAVVGESGAGKSTLIAAVLNLVKLTRGRITWCDKAVSHCRPSLVLQEPRAAFNPTLSLRHSVLEPIVAQRRSISYQRLANQRLSRLCERLALPPEVLDRKPAQVSIGQAQRAAIIRALIVKPQLVLFDEPLSALDAVSQKRTAQLIAELQTEYQFAAMIVTHDLGYAAAHADDIAVLKAGRLVECSNADDFVEAPGSEYGRMLRDAAITLGALQLKRTKSGLL